VDLATAAPARRSESPYKLWQRDEGIPIHTGSFIENLAAVEVAPWERTGQFGAYANLADQEEDDAYILEIAPQGETKILHHLFEALVYVFAGSGATSFWQPGSIRKQTVEWHAGSVFSPPLNCYYQHFNLDGRQPARLFVVTNCPMVMNIYRSPEFIFSDSHAFLDRYNLEDDYFTDSGHEIAVEWRKEWKTNFIPDIGTYKLRETGSRGANASSIIFSLANNGMTAHCSAFPPGHYKKAHRHGPDAHVVIIDGQGYSLLWFEGNERERIKVDWKPGTVLTPRNLEYHQHFNTGPTAARYLALRLGNLDRGRQDRLRISRSGDPHIETMGIPYEEEDPTIFELYAQECEKHGATVVMPQPRYVEPT
jgi:hypothetical protein